MKNKSKTLLGLLILILISLTASAKSISTNIDSFPQKAIINDVPVVIYSLEQDKKIVYTFESYATLQQDTERLEQINILLREVLDVREEELFVSSEKIRLSEDMMKNMATQRDIANEKYKIAKKNLEVLSLNNEALGKKLDKSKRINKVITITSGIVIGGLTTFILIKSL